VCARGTGGFLLQDRNHKRHNNNRNKPRPKKGTPRTGEWESPVGGGGSGENWQIWQTANMATMR